jgi:hypothetical protein
MSTATARRIRTERRIAAIQAVGITIIMGAILFLVGTQAYQFCLTEEQYSPFMGWIGVALPCVAVVFAFGIGRLSVRMEG